MNKLKIAILLFGVCVRSFRRLNWILKVYLTVLLSCLRHSKMYIITIKIENTLNDGDCQKSAINLNEMCIQ